MVAQRELGEFYKKGIGTDQNLIEGFKWIKKAAEQRDSRAYYLLSQAYFKGEGIEKNNELALSNAKKSLALGFEDASFLVDVLSSRVNTQTKINVQSENELNFGSYHALIIGNDDYQNVPKLNTGEIDARAVNALLKTKFNFKTTLMINKTRAEILLSLIHI